MKLLLKKNKNRIWFLTARACAAPNGQTPCPRAFFNQLGQNGLLECLKRVQITKKGGFVRGHSLDYFLV